MQVRFFFIFIFTLRTWKGVHLLQAVCMS